MTAFLNRNRLEGSRSVPGVLYRNFSYSRSDTLRLSSIALVFQSLLALLGQMVIHLSRKGSFYELSNQRLEKTSLTGKGLPFNESLDNFLTVSFEVELLSF